MVLRLNISLLFNSFSIVFHAPVMQVHGDNAVEDALGVHGYGTEDYAVMADNPYKGQLGGQWTELEAVDTGLSAVTHTAFDPFEELLWTANDVVCWGMHWIVKDNFV